MNVIGKYCGQLQSDVFAKVSEIITTGQDLERWQEAGEAAVQERSEVLTRFLGLLGEPIPKPRQRGRKALGE